MKMLLYLIPLLMPVLGTGQSNILSGNWKEVFRTEKNGKAVLFEDTIKINFLDGNEYTWFKKGGFIYRGTYKVDNNKLDMGSRFFTISRHEPGRLVIKDDIGSYELVPYSEPYRSVIASEPEALPVTDISRIAGKWKVYKGTSSEVIKELDLPNRIKTVMIFDRPDKDRDIGYISGGKDPKESPSWKINRFENGLLYCNGRSVRVFEVLRQDKTLILKENGRNYFLKQFKE